MQWILLCIWLVCPYLTGCSVASQDGGSCIWEAFFQVELCVFIIYQIKILSQNLFCKTQFFQLCIAFGWIQGHFNINITILAAILNSSYIWTLTTIITVKIGWHFKRATAERYCYDVLYWFWNLHVEYVFCPWWPSWIFSQSERSWAQSRDLD